MTKRRRQQKSNQTKSGAKKSTIVECDKKGVVISILQLNTSSPSQTKLRKEKKYLRCIKKSIDVMLLTIDQRTMRKKEQQQQLR